MRLVAHGKGEAGVERIVWGEGHLAWLFTYLPSNLFNMIVWECIDQLNLGWTDETWAYVRDPEQVLSRGDLPVERWPDVCERPLAVIMERML